MQAAFFDMEGWEAGLLRQALAAEGLSPLFFAGHPDPFHHPRISECRAVSVGPDSTLGAAFFAACPAVELVIVRGHDQGRTDLSAAAAAGVTVTATGDEDSRARAEHAFSLLMSLARRLPQAGRQALEDRAEPRTLRGIELEDKVLGLVGLRHGGALLTRFAQGFGMKPHCFDPRRMGEPGAWGEFRAFLAGCDLISLHCDPLPGRQPLLDAAALAACKPGSLLVSVSAPSLIDSQALRAALDSGRLAGVGLDLPAADLAGHPLRFLPQALLTPGIASNTLEASQGRLAAACATLIAWQRGRKVEAVPAAAPMVKAYAY